MNLPLSPRSVGHGITLALFLVASGCSCADNPIGTAVSPDKKYTATAIVRNCGATTGYVTIVSVSGPGLGPNLFNRNDALTIKGESQVTLRWSADRELEIGGSFFSEDIGDLQKTLGEISIRIKSQGK